MSLRNRMVSQTTGLRTTAEMPLSSKDSGPVTAPGMMMALNTAKLRIQELEAQGAASKLAVALISPNPKQPRRVFDEGALADLARSIQEVGQLQPVLVRPAPVRPELSSWWRASVVGALTS